MTSALDLAQARTVEFNVKYRILGWNQESQSYPGQFYTDNTSYRTGIDLTVTANSLEVYYYMNGNSDSQVTLYNDTDLSFSIQDVIEFKYIADNQANTVYAKVQQNGNNVLEQTFNNVTGLVFADNMPYNFLGVRFTVPASYASAAQLYLDSTNFKADGSVVWGSTKV